MKQIGYQFCYVIMAWLVAFCHFAVAEQQGAERANSGVNKSVGSWKPLANDGLHDPTNPKISFLQSPADALSQLPHDNEGNARSMVVGNQVKWITALREGYISPRKAYDPKDEGKMKVLDLNILLSKRNSGELPRVLFPHRPHTEWLDCSNCHEWLFKSKAGETKFGMFEILNGEFCGRCHGAVAFPLTQCQRCHRIPFDVEVPKVSTPKYIE